MCGTGSREERRENHTHCYHGNHAWRHTRGIYIHEWSERFISVVCLNSKVKLSLYRTFGKIVEFKKYLRGVGDAGTRLLFRSGTHGLNEELGRHRGREGRKECLLCDAECESVSHVLWDCPAYVSIRSAFMLELRRELGDRF